MLKSYHGRLESARAPFLGGLRDSFCTRVLELLTKAAEVAPNGGLAELCQFCKMVQGITTEEAIRQGIQEAVCAKAR
jgi:hypothetical protein